MIRQLFDKTRHLRPRQSATEEFAPKSFKQSPLLVHANLPEGPW